ncbi:MAG: acetoacetate--CoA ligase [Actinomycetota bacterium]|nr:acetoacetate--CoA ligase [Actinomycetota bacterium]
MSVAPTAAEASGPPLWEPDADTVERANLTGYLRWLREQRGLHFDDYHALWRWSVEDLEDFWASIWDFYGLGETSGYEQVLTEQSMPGARWFTGAKVNFAEQCLRHPSDSRPALVTIREGGSPVETSWADLRAQVGAMAAWLREIGVQPGDRVAAYLPNIPEAIVALLATASVGAVWTASSPDFGTSSVLARLQQVEPTVLIAADGYYYGGKEFDRRPVVEEIVGELPSLRHVVTVDYVYGGEQWLSSSSVQETPWRQVMDRGGDLEFASLDFDHPLWVLWSSGTTGTPKGIVQGHGGIVLELLKAVGLGSDVRADDRFFFMTSTSWMVWNYLVAGLMHGATIVLYDGSATYPDINGVWRVAQDTGATMVGVGAGYLIAGEKAQARPGAELDLSRMRSILQTGSTLPPKAWQWTYEQVKQDMWMQSISGGTDVCSVLAGGCPLLPVYAGRLQAPWLGVDIQAWDSDGKPVIGEEGELVVTRPLPSMPLYFWNDPDGKRYHDSYFDTYPGIWRHGDWITVYPDDTIVISGRSDSTLNRMGVRMGSADIYVVVEQFPEVADSLVVGTELSDGGYFMPLFVVLAEGSTLDDDLRTRITQAIRTQLSPRHVPDAIVPVPAVPRTLTGKKLEVPIKRILQGARPDDVSASGALTHPEMLGWFERFATEGMRGD